MKMLQFNKKRWVTLKEYSLITFGLTIYALGWAIFLLPNNLVGGGISGLSAIIYYATGFQMGYSYFIINALLLVIGIKILGSGFGIKTIYAIAYTSLLFAILPDFIPHELTNILAVENGKLTSTIMGGVMAGLGIGLSLSQGGSSGGTDIIALIICKYNDYSLGRTILILDLVIIVLSLFFPSYMSDGSLMPFHEKLATTIYGLILIIVSGLAVDLYLTGAKQSVQAFIFSRKYDEIADTITTNMRKGVTVVPAKGWYTQKDSFVLMIVVRKADLNQLLAYVKAIDNDAFLSIGSVMGVYGEGFDTIKTRNNRSK